MKFFFLMFLSFFSSLSWAQLQHTTDVAAYLMGASEAEVRRVLLHQAAYKGIMKFASELGFGPEEFDSKLKAKFIQNFESYQERKLIEKFGLGYKNTLTEKEKAAFLETLENERQEAFIKFSHVLDCLRSHSFKSLTRDETEASKWQGKIEVDLDKVKVEGVLRRFVLGEIKQFSKLILLTELEPVGFNWSELGLNSIESFKRPLNSSWMKWYEDHLPSTVGELVICEGSCLEFYSKWIEGRLDQLVIPEEYQKSVLLKIELQLKRIELQLKRIGLKENQNDEAFEWEGRALLQDVQTKRILASSVIALEKRVFHGEDQKVINSALASSLYRSPLTGLLQFNRRLEEKRGFSRVSKLVIKGHPHLGEVLAYVEMLKVRGSSLGLEIALDSFGPQEATLNCFYQGEEKSFSDLLSGIKELKSSHSYGLVNESDGVHYAIKFVTE